MARRVRIGQRVRVQCVERRTTFVPPRLRRQGTFQVWATVVDVGPDEGPWTIVRITFDEPDIDAEYNDGPDVYAQQHTYRTLYLEALRSAMVA